ncbi:hypothetical protein CGRA01v4_02868 [Colletotrichum graminicola]|nr:hypothetical protein CGRA01v4_02868 [Colletotrichum graminicola]
MGLAHYALIRGVVDQARDSTTDASKIGATNSGHNRLCPWHMGLLRFWQMDTQQTTRGRILNSRFGISLLMRSQMHFPRTPLQSQMKTNLTSPAASDSTVKKAKRTTAKRLSQQGRPQSHTDRTAQAETPNVPPHLHYVRYPAT